MPWRLSRPLSLATSEVSSAWACEGVRKGRSGPWPGEVGSKASSPQLLPSCTAPGSPAPGSGGVLPAARAAHSLECPGTQHPQISHAAACRGPAEEERACAQVHRRGRKGRPSLTWGVMRPSARSCSTLSQRRCRASGRAGYTAHRAGLEPQASAGPAIPTPHPCPYLAGRAGGRPAASRRSARTCRCWARTRGPADGFSRRQAPPGGERVGGQWTDARPPRLSLPGPPTLLCRLRPRQESPSRIHMAANELLTMSHPCHTLGRRACERAGRGLGRWGGAPDV